MAVGSFFPCKVESGWMKSGSSPLSKEHSLMLFYRMSLVIVHLKCIEVDNSDFIFGILSDSVFARSLNLALW